MQGIMYILKQHYSCLFCRNLEVINDYMNIVELKSNICLVKKTKINVKYYDMFNNLNNLKTTWLSD